MLRCILLNKNLTPSLKFDWTKFRTKKIALRKTLTVQGEEEIK
jgi:hypothetical protein